MKYKSQSDIRCRETARYIRG